MGITDKEYFLLFVSAYLLVGALTPLMRKIAIDTKVVDQPNASHKSHKTAVPYLGGVAIIIGIISISYSTSLVSNFTSTTFWLATSVLGPALILGLIGLWDDVKNLPPLPRFIAQSIAGIFTASILIITNNVANPTGSSLFDAAITVIWVVGICNSINFFDNHDGGAAGTVAVISLFLFFIAFDRQQVLVSALAIVTAGATAGFLIWNRHPAKIYMGDAGALFLGIIISVLTIRLSPGIIPQEKSFAIPALLMATPILDTTVAVISRLHRGISPFQGGRDHLSHRLMRVGLSRKITAITLWAMAAMYGGLALAVYTWPDTLGWQLIAIASVAWIAKLVFFLRIPSEG